MGFGSYGGEVLGGRLAISAWMPSYAKATEGEALLFGLVSLNVFFES